VTLRYFERDGCGIIYFIRVLVFYLLLLAQAAASESKLEKFNKLQAQQAKSFLLKSYLITVLKKFNKW